MKRLNRFIKSPAGKKFYNFAYCWGACLVILGAVFKIAHMPYDSILLMVGLFTEVFIFFISGFDTPDEEYKWEKVFPVLRSGKDDDGKAGDAAAAAEKSYRDSLEQMKSRIDDICKAYDEQSALVKEISDKVKPETFSELMRQTEEMTALLKGINSRYREMLSSLGQKTE
jgi:hypothetical protein